MPYSRPGSSGSKRSNAGASGNGIGKLDYRPGGRPLLPEGTDITSQRSESEERSYAGSFFGDVAEGIREQDRRRMKKEVTRYISFVWAIISTLGAGSITAYSLYASLFQRRLHYTQLQVNGVSITAELAMYLPVPLFGMLCDRFGPGIPSLLSGCFFGLGYLLAAFTYKSGAPSGKVPGADGWPYWVMVLAFVGVGAGTSCMYCASVTACAKNFGRGRFKGLALALPIACFGLSGMWQSQVGSHLLRERPINGHKGEVDVHRYFLFLGGFLLAVGLLGFFALRVVDEDDLINEAVDELERSGLLEHSEFFQRTSTSAHSQNSYGTMGNDTFDGDGAVSPISSRKPASTKVQRLVDQRKKTWLLNEETRRFLTDRTMWWLAAGFFLVTGPGEAFINNLGTIIGTLYSPPTTSFEDEKSYQTSAATHVSIVAITSTVARILTGTLTDLLAPTSSPHQHRRGPSSLANSMASLPSVSASRIGSNRFSVSRVAFLIAFSLLMSLGQIILASGLVQDHGSQFWLVSASIGAGYGAVFSLTPITISVVWGVENFGTNWGIVATVPALGATVWGLAYSAVYQWAAVREADATASEPQDLLCYGTECYASTFWAMAVSVWLACVLFFFAWRGPGGWLRRGVAV